MMLYYFSYLILPILCIKSNNVFQSLLDKPPCSNMKRFCTNQQASDDLSVLECLHSLHPDDLATLSKECQQIVWSATSNLIKDNNVINSLVLPMCRSDVDRLSCRRDPADNMAYFRCLATDKENIEDSTCQDMVRRMENVAFTDYKFLAKFLKHCEEDVKQLNCGVIDSQGLSQIGTIACLQSQILKVNDNCKKEVFKLSELQADNIRLDQQLYIDCAEDYSRYCSQFNTGSGRIFHCLTRQDPNKLNFKCKNSLFRRESLISQDYKVSKGLMRSCRDDIKKSHCRKQTSSDRTIRLAQILLCLENIGKNGTKVSSDCEAELVEHRRMLMEDFRLSPEIVDKCKKETTHYCRGYETGGKTIHCLMKHAREARDNNLFSNDCKIALEDLVKNSDVGENWKVDPVLQAACSPVVETVCKDVTSGDARVMNCLMDNIGSDRMTERCENALIQIQYFIARRFELDSQLYRACKADASRMCHASSDWDNEVGPSYSPSVLPCLYMHINSDDKSTQLDRSCLQNIRRVMRQRAISVNLEPAIEEACLEELGTFCHDKVEKGDEMKCLQDNYNELEDSCKNTIRLFTEFQSEHAELNYYINMYCPKIIDTLCSQEAKTDEGDIMECLISHKNDPLLRSNSACRGSIEHFQIISLNDYRFSYKFKVACKQSAMRFCNAAQTKNEVVRCLSEHVVNSTVSGVKSQIPKECKQQLRAQLFQQRENIQFDPVLKDACSQDIKKYCGNVQSGNAQVLECLKSQPKKLSGRCEKEVFTIKKQQVLDNSVDYALMTMCADAIEQFCVHQDKEVIFDCLKKNKDEKGFSKKCRQIVTHRIIEQNSNYQLNPSLQQNCNMDINKFCKSSLLESQGKETNGVVIKCLKEQFKLSRLSNNCEKEMASILREQALNLNLNPLIRMICQNELTTICKSDDDDDNSGDTEECLKDAFLNGRIITPECRVEVANMIEESQADIYVDPLLQQACALDLLNFCQGVPQGNGRHISCLKSMLDDNKEISSKCKNMLKKRFEMYRNAALFAPMAAPEDLQQLYNQVVTSPSKQYFCLVILMFLGTIFIVGILCGRLNKRKYMLLKSK
ncbi:Golgi apparatus protein 1 [Euwallacea fornicatus]|uniref:Golgi apparatus protein 1 n=1 Tax=Euwallacea fornicatus TaxID=995702 RepID=UPI00338EEB54